MRGRAGGCMYKVALSHIPDEKTYKREFGNLSAIPDNHPKLVVSMDEVPDGESFRDVEHVHIRTFLGGILTIDGMKLESRPESSDRTGRCPSSGRMTSRPSVSAIFLPLPACWKMFSKITNINTVVLIIRKKTKPEGCRKVFYVETKKSS